VPSIALSAVDQCSTAKVLTQIRPGAAWVMQGDSVKQLKWLDKKQSKPSATEVDKAKQACVAENTARNTQKAKARLEIKDPSTSTDKKLNDLILLLDLDK